MTTTTPIRNNQPFGRTNFRQRGEGVISTTMTKSKMTRTSHDKNKDYDQGVVDFKYYNKNDHKDDNED